MATGSQWDVTQLVAWGRMFAGYSHEMTLTAAAEKTFSGEMCSLCRLAAKGRAAEADAGAMTVDAKSPGKLIELCPVATAARVTAPLRLEVGRVLPLAIPADRDRATPPSPPPRALA